MIRLFQIDWGRNSYGRKEKFRSSFWRWIKPKSAKEKPTCIVVPKETHKPSKNKENDDDTDDNDEKKDEKKEEN